MSVRNYNNVTSLGSLAGPVASSATTLTTTGFTGFPSAPFTITLDRNTVTEEICLVTGVVGSTLTVTRGFDGTAGQAHSAGATVEHTSVALDFTEANTHVNTTTGVHGVSSALVGAQGTQTIYDKTLVSPVMQADVAAGDAVVAYVPSGASARNAFRAVGPTGADIATIDSSGKATVNSAAVTGTLNVAGATTLASASVTGAATIGGNATVTGTTTHTGAVTLNGGVTGTVAATGAVSGTTVTGSGLVKGAGVESTAGLTVAQIAAPAGVASKGQVWAQSDGGFYSRSGTNGAARLPVDWGSVASFPSPALVGDTCYRSDLAAVFRLASGTTWIQMTYPVYATNAARDAQYTTPANIPAGFRIWHSGLAVEQNWDATGSKWRFALAFDTTGLSSDASGFTTIPHSGGQTPVSAVVTPFSASTESQNGVARPVVWSYSSSALTLKIYRTDTSGVLPTQNGLAFSCLISF